MQNWLKYTLNYYIMIANTIMVAFIFVWIGYLVYHNQEDPKNDDI